MAKDMKDRPTIGKNGLPLPILPPDHDPRVWIKMIRVMFYTPGFLALLLIKAGNPMSFGITVELLVLTSATAIVAGLFIGTHPIGGGADNSSKVGLWSGSLVLELLATVPFLCAIPPLFHELAHSALLHTSATSQISINQTLGPSEMLPMIAILPFMLYQLAGFGTLHYIVSRKMNWLINIGIFCLIVSAYAANRMALFGNERVFVGLLILLMAITVFYGVLKLKRMQASFDANCPLPAKPTVTVPPEKTKANKAVESHEDAVKHKDKHTHKDKRARKLTHKPSSLG